MNNTVTTYPLRIRLGVRLQPKAVTDAWYEAGCPQDFDPPVSFPVRLQWIVACWLRGAKRPARGRYRRNAKGTWFRQDRNSVWRPAAAPRWTWLLTILGAFALFVVLVLVVTL